ncbi:MAG: hypothetical protein ACMVY4_14480 [Minwuia sp.]|uniref:hypothetical protein n=1 Tax=Minwuia sp. TaxID=2493630 RepID=UPI003A8A21B7
MFKRLFIPVLAGLAILFFAFLMLGDSGPAPVQRAWLAVFGKAPEFRPNKGFGPFREESQRIEDSFACRRFVELAGDEFSDLRRHCTIGEYETARISIYQPVDQENITRKVKFTWLDNERRNARGQAAPRHADRADARQALTRFAELYVPNHATELMQLFTEGRTGLVSEGPFIAIVTVIKRQGYVHNDIELRDGNFQALAGSEEKQARPGFDRCRYILANIPALKGVQIDGEPVPERSQLYVTYFLNSNRGEKFLCEIHSSGYYRIRVSRAQGEPFQVLAHGDLGGN